MSTSKGLIHAYILDGKGAGQAIGWEEVAAFLPEQGVLWVHLDYTHSSSIDWVSHRSGLDKLSAQAMLAQESRPRSIVTSSGILTSLRGVNLNPGQDPEDMVSVRIWIDKHRIITTRKRKLLSVEDISMAILDGRGPKSPADFLKTLNNNLINRMSDVLENIEDDVESLEEDVVVSESRLLRPKISELRRQTILIRRYLAPQREALNRLFMDENDFLSQVDRLHIREGADRVMRYIEELDSTRERTFVIQEELSNRLSEQMNQRMYILSVVSIIFLPLTFITGLLGINVGGIPGAESKEAFSFVCTVSFGLILFMLWFFHRKKWI